MSKRVWANAREEKKFTENGRNWYHYYTFNRLCHTFRHLFFTHKQKSFWGFVISLPGGRCFRCNVAKLKHLISVWFFLSFSKRTQFGLDPNVLSAKYSFLIQYYNQMDHSLASIFKSHKLIVIFVVAAFFRNDIFICQELFASNRRVFFFKKGA